LRCTWSPGGVLLFAAECAPTAATHVIALPDRAAG
jgi:hypothetical protein